MKAINYWNSDVDPNQNRRQVIQTEFRDCVCTINTNYALEDREEEKEND